jgi:hypothetical protein
MLNLTNNIVFRDAGTDLSIKINEALADTCQLLYNSLYPDTDIKYFDLNRISGTSRNPNIKLSFLLDFYGKSFEFDDSWVSMVFNVIVDIPSKHWGAHSHSILKRLGITEVRRSQGIGLHVIRGLHVFLVALWAKGAILLPMSFSLPKNRKTHGHVNIDSHKVDSAYDLYPPLLKIIRLPFQGGMVDERVINIVNCIPTTSKTNYNYTAWRPVIASSWHETSDINLEELQQLFTYILNNRKSETNQDYRISAIAWARPLFEYDEALLDFTKAELREAMRSDDTASVLENHEYSLQRDTWSIWIDTYVDMLYETGRVKNTTSIATALGKLTSYFFEYNVGLGVEPPPLEEVTRAHIDGSGAADPLRVFIKTQSEMSKIINFFEYVSSILGAQGITFTNPLTKYDKKAESKPTKTNKKTMAFNSFRLFYALSYCLLSLISYLNSIIKSKQYDIIEKILLSASQKNPIIETELLGYIPVVNYIDIQGKRHVIPLKYIPFNLLCLEQLPVGKDAAKKFKCIATPDNIGAVIIALETSIRFIHIRWLDKYLIANEFPKLKDDFTAMLDNLGSDPFFQFFVNTDKSGVPWIRPTSTRVLHVCSVVNGYKKLVARDHYKKKLQYTHHDLTHYPWIAPIFHDNDRDTVLTEDQYRQHYKQLIYFFNQIKLIDNQSPTDPLPFSELDFTQKHSFETAYSLNKTFKTEYTPHGIRATVISLSSTFLSEEHIGENISGHKKSSVNRYCVITKELVQDVHFLASATIMNSMTWTKATDVPVPSSAERLLQTSFALKPPEGNSLTNKEILQSFHQLSVFPTHFCIASGVCPTKIIETIGEYKCGQCYLGLKSPGHINAILALLRNIAAEIDESKNHLKYLNTDSLSDGAFSALEKKHLDLINEFSAWSLTAEHIIKHKGKLEGKFLTIADEDTEIALFEISENNALLNLIARANDAVRYPSLSNSSLKKDIFRMTARLMRMDKSFVEILNYESTDQLISEFRGKLETLLIATDSTLENLSSRLKSDSTPRIPVLNI